MRENLRRTAALLCLAASAAVAATAAQQANVEPPNWDSAAMAQTSNQPGEGPWLDCALAVHLPASAPADMRTHLEEATRLVSQVAGVNYTLSQQPSGSSVTVVPLLRPTTLLSIPGSAAEATSTFQGNRRIMATIIIDLDAWRRLPDEGRGSQRQLVLHELLHTAGVGHAQDRRSTMAPDLGTAVGITPDAMRAAREGAPTDCAHEVR